MTAVTMFAADGLTVPLPVAYNVRGKRGARPVWGADWLSGRGMGDSGGSLG